MSCNFCRDSIEGLKEINIVPKLLTLTNVPTIPPPIQQASSGLTITPEFTMNNKNKLYQCQWCTEYWHKKQKVTLIHSDKDKAGWSTVDFKTEEEAVPLGYDLSKIKI